MNSDISYDPVSVLDEKEAVGVTAKIFKDIRETMNIPLITSIWRGLAEIDDSLKKIWTIAKPIYETQNPEKKLKEIIEEIKVPFLPTLTDDELSKCRLTHKDWDDILVIIKAYNRSNGMNMVVLHSIIKQNFPICSKIPKNNKNKIIWPTLQKLQKKEEIKPKIWQLVCNVNGICAPNGKNSHVATLWRHLAHWPFFLEIMYIKLNKLSEEGVLQSLLFKTQRYLQDSGLLIEAEGYFKNDLSSKAYSVIKSYVYEKDKVIRMVVIGFIMQKWIEEQKFLALNK